MRTDQPRQTGDGPLEGPALRRSSPPPRAWRSTGRSTSPRTTRAVAGHRRRRDGHPRRPEDRRGRGSHLPVGPLAAAGPQADQAGVQGRDQRVPAHPALRRAAELVPLVRRRRPGETVGARALDLPPPQGRGRRPASSGSSSRTSSFPRSSSTGVLKELRTQTFLPWNEKTLGHPERRPRQPRRPAVPRLADPRLRRHRRPRRRSSTASEIATLSDKLPPFASAIHAYDVVRSADLRQGRRDPPAL